MISSEGNYIHKRLKKYHHKTTKGTSDHQLINSDKQEVTRSNER